jgi:hypothetical protein
MADVRAWWWKVLEQMRCDHRWRSADPMILWACSRCGKEVDGWPVDGRSIWWRWL